MLSVPAAVKLWYCPDAVDMRLGFDGLFALVTSRLKADPLSGHLFIFRNRAADRLKVLYWGGHGLCLWCQRLEAGRYHFPDARGGTAALELTAGQFQMVLDGIDLSRVRRFKRFSPSPGGKGVTGRRPRCCNWHGGHLPPCRCPLARGRACAPRTPN